MIEETTSKNAPAADQVKLALEHTFLAHERTLMAWVRTATSLITFGIALYKFYYYVHQDQPPTHAQEVFGARTYGLCMMGFGVAALMVATLGRSATDAGCPRRLPRSAVYRYHSYWPG